MKSRAEIKVRAKALIKENYTMALVPNLLYVLIAAVAASITFGLGFIITLPLLVGVMLVYIMFWRSENPSLEIMFTGAFQENFVRKLGGILWMELFIFLWSMLFCIPGIVKSYSYAMTPYILAKYPNVEAKEALKLSMRIMNGHKLELFILDLSFIGWNLLGGLTFGLLNLFYVSPYMSISRAGFLDEVMYDALSRNVIDASELKIG